MTGTSPGKPARDSTCKSLMKMLLRLCGGSATGMYDKHTHIYIYIYDIQLGQERKRQKGKSKIDII